MGLGGAKDSTTGSLHWLRSGAQSPKWGALNQTSSLMEGYRPIQRLSAAVLSACRDQVLPQVSRASSSGSCFLHHRAVETVSTTNHLPGGEGSNRRTGNSITSPRKDAVDYLLSFTT